MSKTGGGRGTNQYGIKGRSKGSTLGAGHSRAAEEPKVDPTGIADAPELNRELIEQCLGDLAAILNRLGVTARLDIVGGAAIALAHYRRPPTTDVDGFFHPALAVLNASEQVRRMHGLPENWLNDAATAFLPHDAPRFIELHRYGHVTISVAPPELLLAMKLRACRMRKDFYDIAYLLRTCDVRSVGEAKAHLDRFFPEEELSPVDLALVGAALGHVVIPLEDEPIDLPAMHARSPLATCARWVLREDARCALPPGHPGDCASGPR